MTKQCSVGGIVASVIHEDTTHLHAAEKHNPSWQQLTTTRQHAVPGMSFFFLLEYNYPYIMDSVQMPKSPSNWPDYLNPQIPKRTTACRVQLHMPDPQRAHPETHKMSLKQE